MLDDVYDLRFGEIDGLPASATFSPDGRYRYNLKRDVRPDADGWCLTFVMLNPSDANENRSDATVRRCIGFARVGGFVSLEIVNVFPYITKKPAELIAATDRDGPRIEVAECSANELQIVMAVTGEPMPVVVVAWGAHASDPVLEPGVGRTVALLEEQGIQLHSLGELTKEGHPRHPLYLPKIARLQRVQSSFANPFTQRGQVPWPSEKR